VFLGGSAAQLASAGCFESLIYGVWFTNVLQSSSPRCLVQNRWFSQAKIGADLLQQAKHYMNALTCTVVHTLVRNFRLAACELI